MRIPLAVVLALGVAVPISAQVLGFGDGPDPGMVATSGVVDEVATDRVEGFDPVRDVPAMVNWKGDVDPEGSGNCYAMSTLAAYFFETVEWAPDEAGLGWDAWSQAGDPTRALRLDSGALEHLPDLLARSRDQVAEQGKLRIAGVGSLRDFTRVAPLNDDQRGALEGHSGVARTRLEQSYTDRSATTRAFRRWAEAAQFAMQIDAEGLHYLGGIAKSHLGWVPFVNLGRDAVNQDGVNILRRRMREGRPTPLAIHPDSGEPAGHVLLVYEVRETGEAFELVTHDVNYPPTAEGEARPTVVRIHKDGYRLEAFRHDGRPSYDYPIMTVTDPDSGRARRFFRATAGNSQEHLERNHHLGNLVGADRSVLTRIGGGLGFVGEVLNPF